MKVYSLNLKLKNKEELRIQKVYANCSKIPLIGEKIPFDLSYEEFEQVKKYFLEKENSMGEEELRVCYEKFFTKKYLVRDVENPVIKMDISSTLENKVIVYAEEI